MQYNNVPTGSFVLLIQVVSMSGEQTTVRRTVHVGKRLLRALEACKYIIVVAL